MSIKGRVAIITGAGRGVVRTTALRFARKGARVVLFSRKPAPLDDVAAEFARQGYSTENNVASYRGE
jgi:NAD(P)-dependent dehydrogenase (short-subunit alcohol dehydrogenase family)